MQMPRKLKLWNGRGWGRAHYDDDGNKIPQSYKYWCDHVYVCAHSVAEAIRIVNEAVGWDVITRNEVNVYWSHGCWGNTMDGIEPELGVWGTQGPNQAPVRLYPKEETQSQP